MERTKSISQQLGNLISQLTRGASVEYTKDELNYKLKVIRMYKEKIKALNVSKVFKILGTGLISELEILTNKLIRGSKNKNLYNRIVSILDSLLKDGELTNEEVQQYYNKFLNI